MPTRMTTACSGTLKVAGGYRSQARGSLLFVGDHLARSVRGIPCAPPRLR